MSVINKEYYDGTFHGTAIPDEQFDRLADVASDILYAICNIKPDENDLIAADYKKACCYQVELMYRQGGVDAILGFAEADMSGRTESLGDYSVSGATGGRNGIMSFNGIPVSPLTVQLLRRLGLMTRWVYARFQRG